MDRNNPYGRQGGMPARPTPGGYPPAPAGYAPSAGRQPAQARPQNPSSGYGGGGYGGGPSAGQGYGGGGGYGGSGGFAAEPPRSSYQSASAPGARRVRLGLAKVQDPTLQSQYIFSNL